MGDNLIRPRSRPSQMVISVTVRFTALSMASLAFKREFGTVKRLADLEFSVQRGILEREFF